MISFVNQGILVSLLLNWINFIVCNQPFATSHVGLLFGFKIFRLFCFGSLSSMILFILALIVDSGSEFCLKISYNPDSEGNKRF
ncbi:unnamed protein product [Moneuplotes crassus]|uniref:Uncharacterized protein n=1 Tax=Euplotes crassus TaxID=5936 RepID=A0AAD1YAZ1_EUPCR|nr:unnamed protein product [Moneuplotes crassus]